MKKKPSPELIAAAVLLVLAAVAFLLMIVFNAWGMDPSKVELDPAMLPPGSPDMGDFLQTAYYIALGMQGAAILFAIIAALGLVRVTKWGFWLGLIIAVIRMVGIVGVITNPTATLTPAPFISFGVGLAVFILLMLRDTRELIFGEPR